MILQLYFAMSGKNSSRKKIYFWKIFTKIMCKNVLWDLINLMYNFYVQKYVILTL